VTVPRVSSLFAGWPILQIEKIHTEEQSLPPLPTKACGAQEIYFNPFIGSVLGCCEWPASRRSHLIPRETPTGCPLNRVPSGPQIAAGYLREETKFFPSRDSYKNMSVAQSVGCSLHPGRLGPLFYIKQ